jgi:YVTN family beta-propeller protein
MTGEQRDEVEVRADAILARAHAAAAYTEYFEAQMRAGWFEARRYRGYGRQLLAGRRVFRRPQVILLAVILVPCALVAYATADVSVWVADQAAGTISRIDPRTGQVTAVVGVTGAPTSLAIAGRSIWTGTRKITVTTVEDPALR